MQKQCENEDERMKKSNLKKLTVTAILAAVAV
ncbi:energy coupling factor transporter S component ThiW, partial [Soehngenia saccharolytica]